MERKSIYVAGPAEFLKMPSEYQELLVHQLRAHVEGELTGADDYLQLFFPMAPNAFERKVCCERAAEEMDHYIRGAQVLDAIGVDTHHMLQQAFNEREHYRTEGVRSVESWAQRGLFSFIGEAAVLSIIEEMAESSYKPVAEMCRPIIIDEYIHVAQGFRIVKELCETEEGRKEVNDILPKSWAMTLDLFGKRDSERSRLYVSWGLRKYQNEEARQIFCDRTIPKLAALGLDPGDVGHLRKFM